MMSLTFNGSACAACSYRIPEHQNHHFTSSSSSRNPLPLTRNAAENAPLSSVGPDARMRRTW